MHTFLLWPWWTARNPAAESDYLCPVSIAASLWAKSLKMTIIALTHHCLPGMHFGWLLQSSSHWVFDMIYSFLAPWHFSSSKVFTALLALLTLLVFQLNHLCNLLLNSHLTAPQTPDSTQVWFYCEGHPNSWLISKTLARLARRHRQSPAESWCRPPWLLTLRKPRRPAADLLNTVDERSSNDKPVSSLCWCFPLSISPAPKNKKTKQNKTKQKTSTN